MIQSYQLLCTENVTKLGINFLVADGIVQLDHEYISFYKTVSCRLCGFVNRFVTEASFISLPVHIYKLFSHLSQLSAYTLRSVPARVMAC